jgi:hypothetical protein
MMQQQFLPQGLLPITHTFSPHIYLFYMYFFSFGGLHPKGPHIFFYQSRPDLHPKGPHIFFYQSWPALHPKGHMFSFTSLGRGQGG